jgi:hypothetical protein
MSSAASTRPICFANWCDEIGSLHSSRTSTQSSLAEMAWPSTSRISRSVSFSDRITLRWRAWSSGFVRRGALVIPKFLASPRHHVDELRVDGVGEYPVELGPGTGRTGGVKPAVPLPVPLRDDGRAVSPAGLLSPKAASPGPPGARNDGQALPAHGSKAPISWSRPWRGRIAGGAPG